MLPQNLRQALQTLGCNRGATQGRIRTRLFRNLHGLGRIAIPHRLDRRSQVFLQGRPLSFRVGGGNRWGRRSALAFRLESGGCRFEFLSLAELRGSGSRRLYMGDGDRWRRRYVFYGALRRNQRRGGGL